MGTPGWTEVYEKLNALFSYSKCTLAHTEHLSYIYTSQCIFSTYTHLLEAEQRCIIISSSLSNTLIQFTLRFKLVTQLFALFRVSRILLQSGFCIIILLGTLSSSFLMHWSPLDWPLLVWCLCRIGFDCLEPDRGEQVVLPPWFWLPWARGEEQVVLPPSQGD